jgi:signal transduction histidine kinase/ActR/RegA family two-component response regulator
MKSFLKLPIRQKLTVFTMLTSGVALLLALAACFAFEIYLARNTAAGDMTALAEVVAGNAVGPLAFNDALAARKLLAALQARPEITEARLLDAAGGEIGLYRTKSSSPFQPPALGQRMRLQAFRIYVSQPVVSGTETLGTLRLTANIRGTLAQLASSAAFVFFFVLTAALSVAFLLIARFQRTITDPLLALSAAAQNVAESKDYSLRVAKMGDDEIGDLTDAFNYMLAEVQSRDQALRDTRDKLAAQFQDLQRESAERLRAQEETRVLERKLEQTQRLESLGVLAGGIAHDFNNILTGILCSASLARLEAESDSELQTLLKRIEMSSHRAAELCEQMLAYAGKGRVNVRALDINQLIQETLEMLKASVPADAKVEVRLDPALSPIRGDATRVRQVLMNLVLNAAEALGPDPRRITIATHPLTMAAETIARITSPGDAAPGDFVCVEVADTGVGIAPDKIRRIFEPFYTSKFAGRGLGLSAVLGIIRGFGGALDLTSEEGKGTTFRVYFPASLERVITENAPSAVPVSSASRGRSGTVLVVDDEKVVREAATAALSRMGFDVLAVGDGASAVELVRRNPGPLAGVLLDLTMPGMDGAATLLALRKLHPGLKAVLMSGYDQQDVLTRYDDLEIAGFLPKPFTVESLMERAAVLRTNGHNTSSPQLLGQRW